MEKVVQSDILHYTLKYDQTFLLQTAAQATKTCQIFPINVEPYALSDTVENPIEESLQICSSLDFAF